MATIEDFAKLDLRVGVVREVRDFPKARNPSYQVRLDFGPEIGERWSSLQAKGPYTMEDLQGRQVVAVVNLPARNIAGFLSQVLVLGVPAEDGSLSLLEPERAATLGGRVY
ncbi:MAG TPA: tRNA-binding protein [bacterium]|nr:tRNA-binding protein [bacterium]